MWLVGSIDALNPKLRSSVKARPNIMQCLGLGGHVLKEGGCTQPLTKLQTKSVSWTKAARWAPINVNHSR